MLWKRHVDELKLRYIPIGSYSNRSDVDMTRKRYENERVKSLLSNNPHAIDFNTHTSNKTVVPSIEKGAEGNTPQEESNNNTTNSKAKRKDNTTIENNQQDNTFSNSRLVSKPIERKCSRREKRPTRRLIVEM